MWNLHLLEKSPLVLFPNKICPFCFSRKGQCYQHRVRDAVCIIIPQFISNCKILCDLGRRYENKWRGERVEKGEVTLRSDMVYVYTINLPHNRLLLVSGANRTVSDFYTNNNNASCSSYAWEVNGRTKCTMVLQSCVWIQLIVSKLMRTTRKRVL